MDVGKIRQGLDRLVANHQLDKVEAYLTGYYNQAIEEKNMDIQFTLLNDFIGFYKEGTQYDKIVDCGNKASELALKLGLENSADYAKTLFNMANAYREAGDFDNSMDCYNKVLNIYEHIMAEDMLYAELYNNVSVLYQNDEQYDTAAECLTEAISIAESYDSRSMFLASLSEHLGEVLIKNGQPEDALTNLIKAKVLYEINDSFGEEYTECVSKLGELYYTTGQYEKAAEYYERALKDIESQNGINDNYKMIESALKKTYSRMGIEYTAKSEAQEEINETLQGEREYSLKEVSWDYYNMYVKPMISEKFSKYIDQIAVGTVGEGAERFSFDTVTQPDDDNSINIKMWMKKKIFDEIGEKLNEEFNKLPDTFRGFNVSKTDRFGSDAGAMVIGTFYKKVLGVSSAPMSDEEWMNISEWRLERTTNGVVFKDSQGTFSKIRNLLNSYYPDQVWLEKIARYLDKCAKSGQYNYAKMMAKGDYVAAKISLARYTENIIRLAYLLDRTYCPHYDKMHEGIKNSKTFPELYGMVKVLVNYPDQRDTWKEYEYNGTPNPYDNVSMTIESIGRMVSDKLRAIGISNEDDTGLWSHARYVMDHFDEIMGNIEYIKQKL
ncbi:MAG: DUF4037 domain-containing protein [Lachnospiraceae bacterium]|nr:DUF4037 domain-containing protein [Lachnospiraceae bacterium]